MSDFLIQTTSTREQIQDAAGEILNPLALNGIEFIEYATGRPQALGQTLEKMGFLPVARHRSREVVLYRQGDLNIIVNSHGFDASADGLKVSIAALALRVRDARASYAYVTGRGGWEVETHPEVMELNIPAIHGVGGSRIYFVDRYKEFSIYDVDFVPIAGVNQQPPATGGITFFGIVQYIEFGRTDEWLAFYQDLFGAVLVPSEQRYGVMPRGTLISFPSIQANNQFMMQLIEPDEVEEASEYYQRIGLGTADVPATVKLLRSRGVDFLDSVKGYDETRGAVTKRFEGGVVFELVHSAGLIS